MRETEFATMEALRNYAEDRFFEVRRHLDYHRSRKMFSEGFTRGWYENQKTYAAAIKHLESEYKPVSLTFKICVAYEQGYGKGLDGQHPQNPYGSPPECAEAWQIGWDAGEKRRLENEK